MKMMNSFFASCCEFIFLESWRLCEERQHEEKKNYTNSLCIEKPPHQVTNSDITFCEERIKEKRRKKNAHKTIKQLNENQTHSYTHEELGNETSLLIYEMLS